MWAVGVCARGVSVSLHDALSRLIFAGWLPQDRLFGLERDRWSKDERGLQAAHSPGADRSTRCDPGADPTASSGQGSVGQHRQRPAPAGEFAGDGDVGDKPRFLRRL